MNLDRRHLLQTFATAFSWGITGCQGSTTGVPITTPPTHSETVALTLPIWPRDYLPSTSGRIVYVSPTGSDSANGSIEAPLATLARAILRINAGDTIVLADGIYRESVVITRSGSSNRYITLRAANAGQAKLIGPQGSYSALSIRNAAWIRVEGLDVKADKGHGIESYNSHHIQVVNNTCHDCGGSGISMEAGDYFLIEGNQTYRNASTNKYQTSGISIYQARALDQLAGFHIYVLRNFSHHNIESNTGLAQTTEGNGIILDDFHNSQKSPGNVAAGAYAPATLVENNLIAFNGGGGIVAYETSNATVRHNTVVFNNNDPLNVGTLRGELANSQGKNNKWYNNIAVANSKTSPYSAAIVDLVTGGYLNTGSEWAGNLLFDTAAPLKNSIKISGVTNLQTVVQLLTNNLSPKDPSFIKVYALSTADTFSPSPDSPAVNAARSEFASAVDFTGKLRTGKPDIGALEL